MTGDGAKGDTSSFYGAEVALFPHPWHHAVLSTSELLKTPGQHDPLVRNMALLAFSTNIVLGNQLSSGEMLP